MRIAPVGPAYRTDGDRSWSTSLELAYLEGLGHWSPIAVPRDERAYRTQCLRGWLASLELRVIRGSVDWAACKARAIALLRAEETEAA